MAKPEMYERVKRIEERFDWLDEHGTRAVNVLALQVSELTKDFGELKGYVQASMKTLTETRRVRWTTVLGFIAIILPMYALIFSILTHPH